MEADMTNREWLYSLDPSALKAWFETKHSNAAGAEQAPMMGHAYESEPNGTAYGESDGADANIGSRLEPRDYAGPVSDLYDTRKKVEADASELTADYAISGDVCDSLYHGILALLDRQADITRYEVENEHADEIYALNVVRGVLQAEVSNLKADMEAKVSGLQADLEAAYAKNRSLRTHIRKMQEGRNGWHIKAKKLQKEVDELQKQVDKLKDGRKCETCDEPARAGSIRPFLVWDYKGNLLITLGGLRTWDVTAEARAWFKKFGGDAR